MQSPGYRQTIKQMPADRKDEIGSVARALKALAMRVYDISLFRKTIEADADTIVIYKRLSRIFREQLGLHRFFILEAGENQDSLKVVLAEPPELVEDLPTFSPGSVCRAMRTGDSVNSFEFPEICAVFPFGRESEHV